MEETGNDETRTVLRYQKARKKLSQAQALLKLIAAQLP
jgi:hypothetical protein